MIGKIVRCGLVLIWVTGVTGCGSNAPTPKDQPAVGNAPTEGEKYSTLRRGLPGEPQTLDPQIADDTYSFQVVRDLYEGLTAEDRAGHVVPGVASSWSADKTGTIYTFQLRSNAKWSDGQQIVAADFVRGFQHAVDPKTASGSAALLNVIKNANAITSGQGSVADLGVAALGDTSVQIELEHPAPYILEILAQPISAPLYLEKNRPMADPNSSAKRVTNGPYVLGSRVPNSFTELTRNPYYWDLANVAIDKIRYVNVESETTELHEYLANQLDVTFTVPMPDLERISRQFPAEVQIAPFLGTFYLALNMSTQQLNESRPLRQALSMAVDRDVIAHQVMAGVTPAYSFVAKGISEYHPQEYEWAHSSRDRQISVAKDLFKQAGFSSGRPLKLKLYFNRDEAITRIMVAIAASWKSNLGVESELISDEFRVFLAGRKQRNRWDVARLAWNADYDDPASFLDVFASNNSENDPGYGSQEYNELIGRARVEPEVSARLRILEQSEKILLDDYPIIPIYFYVARRLVKPYVGGAELSPLNHSYSKHFYWTGTR